MLATAPGLRFTWSAKPPDNIKLRKVRQVAGILGSMVRRWGGSSATIPRVQALVVYPLKVRLGVDFNVRTKQLSYHAMCKETILGGTIGLNTDVSDARLPWRLAALATSLESPWQASWGPLCSVRRLFIGRRFPSPLLGCRRPSAWPRKPERPTSPCWIGKPETSALV